MRNSPSAHTGSNSSPHSQSVGNSPYYETMSPKPPSSPLSAVFSQHANAFKRSMTDSDIRGGVDNILQLQQPDESEVVTILDDGPLYGPPPTYVAPLHCADTVTHSHSCFALDDKLSQDNSVSSDNVPSVEGANVSAGDDSSTSSLSSIVTNLTTLRFVFRFSILSMILFSCLVVV